MKRFCCALLTAVFFILTANLAMSGTFNVGSALITGIGDEIGSGWDKLDVAGNSGTYVDNTKFTLTTFSFTQGGNCYGCGVLNSAFNLDVTLDGLTQTLSIPYVWIADIKQPFGSPYYDSISILGGHYAFGDNTLSILPTGKVYANAYGVQLKATVPEPALISLLGIGILAAMGLGAWKKK